MKNVGAGLRFYRAKCWAATEDNPSYGLWFEAVEKEITELLAHSKRIDAEKIEEFLRSLRSAIRKLDRHEPSKK